MIENIIAERYARALLSLAQDKGPESLDAFGLELQTFLSCCEETPELLTTLGDRYQDLFARERIVDQVASKAGFSTEVKNFIKLLVHKGRISLLATVVEEYVKLAHTAQGRLVMKVVSATTLSDDVYQSLVKEFQRQFQKQMVLKTSLSPDVLGGVRVHVGDCVYDYTVSHQIEKFKQTLLDHA